MGFLQNTVSFTTYRLPKAPDGDLRQTVLEGLQRGRVSTIDIDLGRDRSSGFAVFENPLSSEFEEGNIFFDPLIAFAMRMDKLSVPPSTQRLYIQQRIRENLLTTGRAKLPKQEREELTEQVRLDLLRRAIPAITVADVIWDMRTSMIRLYSTSTALNDEFMDRFHHIFGIHLIPMNTVGILESILDERSLHDVYYLLPTSFLAGGEISPLNPVLEDE